MSIKAALLNNGNIEPSIPLNYALHLEINYDSIKQLVDIRKL